MRKKKKENKKEQIKEVLKKRAKGLFSKEPRADIEPGALDRLAEELNEL